MLVVFTLEVCVAWHILHVLFVHAFHTLLHAGKYLFGWWFLRILADKLLTCATFEVLGDEIARLLKLVKVTKLLVYFLS